jgi:hypothetical protein
MAISKAVSISIAPIAASTKKSAGKLVPKIIAATFAANSRKRAVDPPARRDLRSEELAVELGKPDGDPGSDERSGHHGGSRLLGLERNDEPEPDDRAVDEARELAGPEVLVDGARHRSQYRGPRSAAATSP